MATAAAQLGLDGLILEGIVTTLSEDGSVNISPMGPVVDGKLDQFVFRPYVTSTTFQNLKREGQGVFHITDDVMLFSQAAVGQPSPMPSLAGLVLQDACRWFRFEVQSVDDSQEPAQIVASTIDRGRIRDFLGFNRAKHAVIEAAILATRVEILPESTIREELSRVAPLVDKTASASEREAFEFLQRFIASSLEGARACS